MSLIRTPFGFSSTTADVTAGLDLTGRKIVVTGGASDLPFAYGQAKTANVLFGVGATARWADDGIFANAAMPGPTLTGFQRNMDPERLRQRLGGADLAPGEVPPGFKTLQQGAATTVFLAASPLVSGIGGRYFEDSNEAVVVADNNGYRSSVAPYALDQANADRLWSVSQQLLD